jgi:hypothetical protein
MWGHVASAAGHVFWQIRTEESVPRVAKKNCGWLKARASAIHEEIRLGASNLGCSRKNPRNFFGQFAVARQPPNPYISRPG